QEQSNKCRICLTSRRFRESTLMQRQGLCEPGGIFRLVRPHPGRARQTPTCVPPSPWGGPFPSVELISELPIISACNLSRLRLTSRWAGGRQHAERKRENDASAKLG